ncbi:MAG: GFA family protein [Gammaproteobacteria bacterium]|nr:GFA family protein [Gammaproteobacteria bacterium]
MTAPFSGGCVCGAIRYECTAEPVLVAHCCCTDCQRTSGAQMSTNVLVPAPAFRITAGATASYDTRGDSGNFVTRHFCARCGSNLYSMPQGMGTLAVIKAGTLDDSSWLQPGMSIYTDSAPRWAVLPDGIPKFPKMPPM